MFLSPQSIDALAEIISGGGGMDPDPPIGIYRSGTKLEQFMRRNNVSFKVEGSRVPSLIDCLNRQNTSSEAADVMTRIVESAADPRDFMKDPDRHQEVVTYLNRALSFDGYELQSLGTRVRLVQAGKDTPVLSDLAGLAEEVDFDTVRRDLERALESLSLDPEGAVTSACSTLESVCRSILVELDIPLPAKKDIQGLYNAVKDPLGLSAGRTDIDPQIANDVRQILSGLSSVISGVGALRTHAGDAHGRERGFARIDVRIARFAVHTASTTALFLLETWQRKYPDRSLHNVDLTS
ncbi:abortive infection family protein [Nocardioides marinus]|nr:abortive infection family protein [Nocardioides marinus]